MQTALNTKDSLVGLTKITDKGQVLIPLEMRNKLGLSQGTKLIVIATEDVVVLQRAVIDRRREPKGIIRKVTWIAKRFFRRS